MYEMEANIVSSLWTVLTKHKHIPTANWWRTAWAVLESAASIVYLNECWGHHEIMGYINYRREGYRKECRTGVGLFWEVRGNCRHSVITPVFHFTNALITGASKSSPRDWLGPQTGLDCQFWFLIFENEGLIKTSLFRLVLTSSGQ